MDKEETLHKIKSVEEEIRRSKQGALTERERILRTARKDALELRDALRAEAEKRGEQIRREASEAVAREKAREPGEDVEEKVLALIGELDRDGKGAPWDALLASAAKVGVRKEVLEEAVNELLDKGLVYEPVLGRMKKI